MSNLLPLKGRRIAITRAQEQSAGLVEQLRLLGAEPLEVPAIRIAPLADFSQLDRAIRGLASYDWIIFTSVNGVEAFAGRMEALGVPHSLLCHRKLGAIGPATRASLQTLGCTPDFMPGMYVAEAIVEQIGAVAGLRFLLPRADIARAALGTGLRRIGAIVDEVTAYRTVHGTPNGEAALNMGALLRGGSIDAITFTSSSTVRYTVDGLVADGCTRQEAVEMLNRVAIACIGPITAGTAREYGLSVTAQAEEYTTEGLVSALVALFAGEGKDKRDVGSK